MIYRTLKPHYNDFLPKNGEWGKVPEDLEIAIRTAIKKREKSPKMKFTEFGEFYQIENKNRIYQLWINPPWFRYENYPMLNKNSIYMEYDNPSDYLPIEIKFNFDSNNLKQLKTI